MELEIGTLSERDVGTSPSFTSSPAATDSAIGSVSAVIAIADLAATSVVVDAAASVEKIKVRFK